MHVGGQHKRGWVLAVDIPRAWLHARDPACGAAVAAVDQLGLAISLGGDQRRQQRNFVAGFTLISALRLSGPLRARQERDLALGVPG